MLTEINSQTPDSDLRTYVGFLKLAVSHLNDAVNEMPDHFSDNLTKKDKATIRRHAIRMSKIINQVLEEINKEEENDNSQD